VTERKGANAAFYGQKVSCKILRGQVSPPENNPSLQNLFDALRGAGGGDSGRRRLRWHLRSRLAAGTRRPTSAGSATTVLPVDSLHPAGAFAPEKSDWAGPFQYIIDRRLTLIVGFCQTLWISLPPRSQE